MVAEAFTSCSYLIGVYPFGIGGEPALQFAGLEGTTTANGIRVIAGFTCIDLLPHKTIALVIVYWYNRPVDGDLVKVWPAKANQLSIGIGEQPALHQWVIGEIDT